MGHLMTNLIGQEEGEPAGWSVRVDTRSVCVINSVITLCILPNADVHKRHETITLGKVFPKGEGRTYDSAETQRILTNLQPPSVSALYPSLNNTAARLERGYLSKKEM